MSHIYDVEVGDQLLIIETGRLANQAAGAITVAIGETVVLVTACVNPEPRPDIDFFPLTIDFEERMYAVGKIPGSFPRREGRPSTDAVLAGRMTDRALRPLFPKGFRNDVQIIVTVLSADMENDPDVLATIGASAALSVSQIPFNGPVSAIRVGYVDGEYVLYPTYSQLQDEHTRPHRHLHAREGDHGRSRRQVCQRRGLPRRRQARPRIQPEAHRSSGPHDQGTGRRQDVLPGQRNEPGRRRRRLRVLGPEDRRGLRGREVGAHRRPQGPPRRAQGALRRPASPPTTSTTPSRRRTRSWSVAASSTPASAPMAALSTNCGRLPATWASCHERTAPASSSAARPRSWVSSRLAP